MRYGFMQRPTTPFAAVHFALRFWLTMADAPSLQTTEASTSSTLQDSVSPLS
jgi:hypothetical protein